MSVVGFDIGNENCVIAVAKGIGIDVLLNDESTPAVISFGEKQRFLGSAGAAFATSNPKSTISQIKRLIGRMYKDPSVQEDLRLLPFETSEGPRGGVLIHLQYLNNKCTFTPVEILGMLFSHLKQMTEKNLESSVVDCVIGIPSYFTDLQRREYLNAASIAGLRPLQLMHDCTAIALGYGMHKTDFSGEGPTNVVFVDIGHSDTQVTVVAFEKGKMTILSHSFDPHLGGRDFDDVLFRHFATQFKAQHNIDVYSNARASARLRASCEELKKVLSSNAEAPLSIECLIDGKDLNGSIRRKEFVNLSQELLERVTAPCRRAVNDSGLSVDQIQTIELVGSGFRVPAIIKKIALLFHKEPVRTVNGSECVARGCALGCAMLSPALSAKEYKVHYSFPYSIGVYFNDDENKSRPKVTLFQKGSPFPSNITVPYHGNTTFSCQVFYNYKTDFPAGVSPEVGLFSIGPSQTFGAEKVVAKVKVQLNIHGIVEIESASLEDKHPSSENSLLCSSTEHHAEDASRGCASNQNLEVSENHVALTIIDELHEAQKRAQMFAVQDIKEEQIKEKRNTLKSLIYDTVCKLLGSYQSVATESEVEIISNSLQKAEDWVYGEGDGEFEQVLIRKLDDLTKLLDPIEKRYKDEIALKEATRALQTSIQENRFAAELLPPSKKKEVNNECLQAERWLNHLSPFQDSLAKNATRVYCLNAISEITQALKWRCKVIMARKYEEPVDSNRKKNPDGPQVDN